MSEAGSNIRRDGAGNLPLDDLIIRSLESYKISFYLLPMIAATSGASSYHDCSNPYEDPSHKGQKGKGKGKKKTKGERVQTWVPPKLRGGKPTNDAGHPICFNYTLDGCDAAKPGSACPRGLHMCCSASRTILSPAITTWRASRINPDSQGCKRWSTSVYKTALSLKFSLAQVASLHGSGRSA